MLYKHFLFYGLLALIGLFNPSWTIAGEGKGKMLDLRVYHHLSHWQYVFKLSKFVHIHHFTLHSPKREVFDLFPINTYQKTIALGSRHTAYIKNIRMALHDKTLRIVFDMKKPSKVVAYLLRPPSHCGYRLVVDIDPSKKAHSTLSTLAHRLEQKTQLFIHTHLPKARRKGLTLSKPKWPTQYSHKPYQNNTIKLGRNIVIVIDPGHGGKDPGAIGPNGTNEKTVVLAIAKILQKIINQKLGFQADLTRHEDHYIPLRGRLKIARKDRADMFISIHADAYRNPDAYGASVFALSQRGATSEAARWLAERENQSELMGGVDLADKGALLRSVLLNLSQTATIRESLEIGKDIMQALRYVTPLHHGHVEQAAFVVLKSPDIPSLLVETEFISNWSEERALNNSRYQKRLAGAIAQGIEHYFITHPPHGSMLSHRHQDLRYKVRPGNTLSGIASHYGVSMQAIKIFNHLSTDSLRIGQILYVPT